MAAAAQTGPSAQVDLDLGNYERFLDITLRKDNNLTTGKIYQVRVPGAVSRWCFWAPRWHIPTHTACH